MNKTWLLVPTILILSTSQSFATQPLQQRPPDKKTSGVIRQQFERTESWYDELNSILTEYYGKASSHERVRGFLEWTKQHRKPLLDAYKQELESGKVPRVNDKSLLPLLGFWLGIRYDAHHYQRTTSQRFPAFKLTAVSRKEPLAIAYYDEGTKLFVIGTKFLQNFELEKRADGFIFIRALNVGIHEGAHALSYINARSGMLSELGVYEVHTSLALPLRFKDVEDKDQYRFGSRDFNHVMKQFTEGMKAGTRGLAPDYLESEYLGFMLGPWIDVVSSESDPLSYLKYTRYADEIEFTLASILFNADQMVKLKLNPNPDPFDDGPMAVDYLVSQFCEEAGVKNKQVKEKITKLFNWIHDCVGGSACSGEYNDLYRALSVARNYAEKTEKSRSRRALTVPPEVLRARILFMKFLGVLQSRLTEIFGSPKVISLPDGFVRNTTIPIGPTNAKDSHACIPIPRFLEAQQSRRRSYL